MIHKSLGASTATVPTGLATQHRLFRLASGPYAGRMPALYARTPSILSVSYANAPYVNWSDPLDVVTESADASFSGVMDDDGNLYLAYTQEITGALRSLKLVHSNGSWIPQTASTVYDSASSSNGDPSILKDAYDRLWVVWTRNDAGTVTVRTKLSVDDGATFGSGSTDAGTDVSGSVSSGYGLLIARAAFIHCLYSVDGTSLRHRPRHLDAALWSSEETLYTGAGAGSDFHAAVAADARLGVCFAADGELFLKEYDGAAWGALQTVSTTPVSAPLLRYIRTVPHMLYLRSIGTGQNQLVETHRDGTVFTTPVNALSQLSVFATVLCHDADAPTPFVDLTAAAADAGGADILHPSSSALMADIGDSVYLGGEDRFTVVHAILATTGSGGAVEWSYWNGQEWITFAPDSGLYHFNQADRTVRLFADGTAAPGDWQRASVNGINRYWVRAVVSGSFTTPPVGSQLTALVDTSGVRTLS